MPHESPPSMLEKAPTGITGFDEISHGGLPRGRTSLVMGGPGTGKTIFALETLANGCRLFGEPGIYVAFEENSRQIKANAEGFAWDLATLEDDKLAFVDGQLPLDTVTAGDFNLEGMLASIQAKVDVMGARRIVFDSVDVLLSLFPDPGRARLETYRIHDWLQRSGLTGIITTRIEPADANTEAEPGRGFRYPFLLFMADCVVALTNRVAERMAVRELRILKYRGSRFEQNEFPFVIGPSGIDVGTFGLEDAVFPISSERVSSGVSRLDTMLAGGYYRGSSILITGAPGTAKTSLAGAFCEAACRRGERTLYVAFDEDGAEIVRNLASIGLRLGQYIEAGLLRMHSARTEARGAEEHLLALKSLVTEFVPSCMVIDPLSAMAKAGGRLEALGVAQRLLHYCKLQGITLLSTSLLETVDPLVEASQIRISTIADTWIHVSFVSQAGERNRALSIVKARGIRHSSQVRELVLSDQGITLADVYTAGGQVLMGTLRDEREAADRLERDRLKNQAEQRRRELELAAAEVSSRIINLQRELEGRRRELALLEEENRERERSWQQRQGVLRELRGADEPGPSEDQPASTPR